MFIFKDRKPDTPDVFFIVLAAFQWPHSLQDGSAVRLERMAGWYLFLLRGVINCMTTAVFILTDNLMVHYDLLLYVFIECPCVSVKFDITDLFICICIVSYLSASTLYPRHRENAESCLLIFGSLCAMFHVPPGPDV